MINYPVAIFKDEGMNNYGALVPDVDGCFPLGDTIDETIANSQALIFDHIETMLELDMPFEFTTSSIEELRNDPEYNEALMWAIVSVDESKLSTKQVRFNVSWNECLLHKVDDYIAKTHDTRSGFLAKAVLQAMQPVNAI